ncbi:MAG: hypothetical protein KUG77_25825 [Nannocystaceae bacterium]|nr:hypothetical protein [Nannocystaceae bacterium]
MLRLDQLPPPVCAWTGPRAWVERVTAALVESRWVTIVGPVGSGKTRLAHEAAAEFSPPLAGHIQLGEQETTQSLEAKLRALRVDEHPLLVVDAADRAPDAVRTLLPRWLGVHEARRVLVSSRVQLGPGCDTTLWMPSLDTDAGTDLFERFMREVGVAFDFDAHRAELTRALRDLGGAPAAILGLAQRALVLDAPDLFVSVSQARGRLDLPTPGGTLRDAATEAWLALPARLRPAVSALAVFAEPALPDEIANVCKLDAEVLQTLFAHSAIRPLNLATQKRLEVVPLLRDFAIETAADPAAQRRHATFFLSRAQTHPGQTPWRELAAAAQCAPDPKDALALWVAAAPAIAYGGSARRALAALERLWPEHPTPAQRLAFGSLARIAGESSRGLAELKAGYDDAADPAIKAELACALATTQRHTDNIQEARTAYERLTDSADTPDSTRARAYESLGGLELEQGSPELAEQHFGVAEDLFHRLADLAGVARVRHVRGLLAQERGELDAAEVAFTLALRDHQASGVDRFAAIATFDLGALFLERGRIGAARRALQQALHALRHAGDRRQVGLTHALLAICASEDGNRGASWLALRKAREALDPADVQARETLELYASHLAGSPPPTTTTRSDEARYAQRLIVAIKRRTETRVSIREDGSVIDHPTRGRAQVRSDAARSILATLVAAFERGAPNVHRDDLIHAGWPGRRRVDTASRNRLNVELSRLRKAGLHEQLVRDADAYQLTGPLLVEACTAEE